MSKQTAMQQLLHQMREERTKLPLPSEWDRAYQAIEMVIETTYIPLEDMQIKEAFKHGEFFPSDYYHPNSSCVDGSETYYNETYGGNK
jgi:hypothetical protein